MIFRPAKNAVAAVSLRYATTAKTKEISMNTNDNGSLDQQFPDDAYCDEGCVLMGKHDVCEVPSSKECFWPTGCSDRKRCSAFGSCVAKAQAGGAAFAQQMEPDTRPLSHMEILSAVGHHAREIARLTETVPVKCTPDETNSGIPVVSRLKIVAQQILVTAFDFGLSADHLAVHRLLLGELRNALDASASEKTAEQPACPHCEGFEFNGDVLHDPKCVTLKSICVCGDPAARGVQHRTDGPCIQLNGDAG